MFARVLPARVRPPLASLPLETLLAFAPVGFEMKEKCSKQRAGSLGKFSVDEGFTLVMRLSRAHLYLPLLISTHFPPFLHGFFLHGLRRNSHRLPFVPRLQIHLKNKSLVRREHWARRQRPQTIALSWNFCSGVEGAVLQDVTHGISKKEGWVM